ncbi:hypothetical protein DSL72_003280 [Monilinia vaccinii-corymbosi]|uniref:Uncharacterized protein n=1 Tax=Monilinia vaccinii-corymbosi TaxID=61207 RepID=A0A8A3NSU4_9HELO|nr:hypothetical protein DSL72_003280 [Monilinia vaccinii-corymbosi]
MDLADDSLSYVDHALFDEVINMICSSFKSQNEREDIVLGTIFMAAFHRFNKPQNNGLSEAWKFKMMLRDMWDLVIADENNSVYQELRAASIIVAEPTASSSGVNFSKLIPLPTDPKGFLGYVEHILNAAKRHAISLNPLYGIDITGQGSQYIKRAFIGDGESSINYSQRILGVPLDIVSAYSREYIVCGYHSPVQKEHMKYQSALDIIGVWFRRIIREDGRYGPLRELRYFIEELAEKLLDAGDDLSLEELHIAAGGESLLAHRIRFSVVPESVKRLPRMTSGPKKRDWKWPPYGKLYQLLITDVNFSGEYLDGNEEQNIKKAIDILGVDLHCRPSSNLGEVIVFKPFPHQMIDHCEASNHRKCQMVLEIITTCAERAGFLKNQRQGSCNVLKFLFELVTESNITLEKLSEAATSMKQKTAEEISAMVKGGDKNGSNMRITRRSGRFKSGGRLLPGFYSESAKRRA